MFKTIEEGLEVYREAVAENLKFTKEAMEGDVPTRSSFEKHNYKYHRLRGMAAALGLSVEEAQEIENEERKLLENPQPA